ncbi:hypothetical protein ISN44_As02g005200 [Arabidopsis suecica]|uniref:Uncharacterized protein n=1 Tax=Arabidopsis suecica TaxID=45249 RepID=A0A8T2G1L6_ARASU|nr:hypothetical protein ISN44_As02g005200 [Arabidopsis suecica]
MPLKRSRGRESVEDEGGSLGLPSRRYDVRERVMGRWVRRDVAEYSRVMSKIGSSDTVAYSGLARIIAMSERIIREDLAPGAHEIVMVHDYVSVSSSSSATPS